MFVRCPTYLHLYPCTLPTAPVSRSFGLRSSYEIDILDTDQRPRNKSLRLLNQFKLSMWNFCRSRCGALHNLLYCPVTINLLCPIVKLRPLFTLESTWLNLYYSLKKSARISRRNYTDLTAGAYAIQLSPLPLALAREVCNLAPKPNPHTKQVTLRQTTGDGQT